MRMLCRVTFIFFLSCLMFHCSAPSDQLPVLEKKVKTSDYPVKQVIHPEQKSDTLMFNLKIEPITLNPILITTIDSLRVAYLIFESLVDVDQNLQFVPRLASSWEVSEKNKTLTFHLRKGVTWHDGQSVSANDVIFTYRKATDESISGYRFRGLFEDVSNIEALDDLTVIVTYKKPFASALQSWTDLAIIPEHIYGQDDFMTLNNNDNPVGSGPYSFEEWNKGKTIKLKAFNDYWYGCPTIPNILFRTIPSDNIAFKSLLQGDIHGLEVNSTIWLKFIKSPELRQKFNNYKLPTLNFWVIAWNADGSNGFFNDTSMRQVMTLSIDRQNIIKKLMNELADVCTGPFSPYSWGYDHTIKPWPFDLKQAASMLDQAEWKDTDRDGIRDKNGNPLKFSLIIRNNNRQIEQIASMIQYNFEMIGIVMDIQRLENASYIDRLMKKDYHACLMALDLPADPDIYPLLHSSQIKDGFNITSYSNEEVDQLLLEARGTYDQKERAKLYHKIHRLVHEDQPYTFLFSKPDLYIVDKRVKNILISPKPLYLFFPGILEWSFSMN